MKRILKRVGVGLLVVVVFLAVSVGGYATVQSRAFDQSMARVYDIAPLPVKASTDPAVIARGKHLAESIAACAGNDCHGPDLGGGKFMQMGPLGSFQAPNISPGGLGAAYSDGELARLIRHGVKKDGRSVTFMPAQDINWMPDSDLVAVISYVRSVPKVDKPNGPMNLGTLAKVLDQKGMITLDVARRIDHTKMDIGPAPAPTAEYGRYIGRLCTGCHGDHLSGGPIPGAPSSLPKPLNITPHESGLKDWSFDDFDKFLSTGIRKNGQKLDPFMPLEAIGKMDETERKALWAYLRTVEPRPYGGR